jgi:TP901 family phage tail tape measure protein
MGGTAFSKALIKMELAVESGGQSLKDFAKVSGLTTDEFKRLFKSDPAAAFQAFIGGLAKMDDEGVSAISTLQDIGFKEVRLRDTTLRMVNATELLNSTQSIANKAWRDNSAITTRVAERYNTTANRLKMLNNRAQLTASTFGEVMLPTMEDVMSGLSGMLDGFAEMDEGQRKALISTAAWIATIGPSILLIGKLNTGIGAVSTTLGKLLLSSAEAGGGVTGMLSALKGLLGPAGIAAVAAAALYGAYKWYDYASGAAAAREGA